jgi:hypothetical protein
MSIQLVATETHRTKLIVGEIVFVSCVRPVKEAREKVAFKSRQKTLRRQKIRK